MDLTPLAFSLLCALLAVCYAYSCVLNLIEWCLRAGRPTL